MDAQPTPAHEKKSSRVPPGKGLTAKKTVRSQPSPSRTDLQALIAKRAYELHAGRG